MRALFLAAAAVLTCGAAAAIPVLWAGAPVPPPVLPAWYHAGLAGVFGGAGLALYVGGHRDVRARWLGLVLLLFATLFADRLLTRAIPQAPSGVADWIALVATLPLMAFSPWAFWQFAWRFPNVQPGLLADRTARRVARATLSVGWILFVAAALSFGTPSGPLALVAAWLSPEAPSGLFWQIVSLLTLPPLALLVAKLRTAPARDRQRLRLFVLGLVAGTLPMVAHALLVTILPPYDLYTADPYRSRTIGMLLSGVALIIPAIAAYAVLVDQVLEVRFLIRRAVQYALARYTLIGLMIVPAVGLVWIAYARRARPLGELFATGSAFSILLVVGVLALLGRRTLLDAVDRYFFREQYDARRILVDLVEGTTRARTAADVIALTVREIDRALHLERAAMLIADGADTFEDPDHRVRTLSARGSLAWLIGGSHRPLDVDLSADSSPLSRLPEDQRQWLIDSGCRLLVPLLGATGGLVGFLALGDKRNELPFTSEDRMLLTAVAGSAALVLEQRLQSERGTLPAGHEPSSQPACECTVCGRVQPRLDTGCASCGGDTREALVPAVLGGKFDVEQRIGAGGMGVVYRARDLTLNRHVALKVLPQIRPHAGTQLRREARAMALVQHPHLALIYGTESWRGAPVLVLEFLPDGTLADRLRHGPLPLADVVHMGTVIGDVLHHLHRAGLLHRDVKPSNIGYARHEPKLLDFGLVHLISQVSSRGGEGDSTATRPAPDRLHLLGDSVDPEDHVQRIVGTAAYLSPEAIAMQPPTHAVDVWGLAVTLFEALTGRNPFTAATLSETFTRIARGAAPDVRELQPDCPPAMTGFFARALAASPARRPATAADLIAELRAAAGVSVGTGATSARG